MCDLCVVSSDPTNSVKDVVTHVYIRTLMFSSDIRCFKDCRFKVCYMHQ